MGAEIVANTSFASSISPPEVSNLGSVGELQAAIDMASSSDRPLVALMFKRDGCKACVKMQELFVHLADDLNATGLFFTVDCMSARAFCKEQVGVKAVPTAHIYVGGELVVAMGVGNVASWREFCQHLYAVASRARPRRRWW